MSHLSHAEARAIVAAALIAAAELDQPVAVAVCDAGGDLLALERMDGASAISSMAAAGKASGAALSGVRTSALAEVEDREAIRAMFVSVNRPAVLFGGGVPMRRNGIIVGACGVSGASTEQDEACADAGIAAV